MINKLFTLVLLTISLGISAQWDTTDLNTVISDLNRPYRTKIDSIDRLNIEALKAEIDAIANDPILKNAIIKRQLDSLTSSKTIYCVVESYLDMVVKQNWSYDILYYLWDNILTGFHITNLTTSNPASGYLESRLYYNFITANPEFNGRYTLLVSNILDHIDLSSLKFYEARLYSSQFIKKDLELFLSCDDKFTTTKKRKNLQFILKDTISH